MKSISFPIIRALLVCALVAMMAGAVSAQTQDTSKDKAPQASKGEEEALSKIQTAPDLAAKIQAAGEFIKKYPKSIRRAEVISYLAGEINKGADAAQKITQLESLQTVFKEPADSEIISPLLLEAYLAASRTDDAFRIAAAAVAKNPNDVVVLSRMGIHGIEEARKGNANYLQQGVQYSTKAVEVIESGVKPVNLDEARWGQYKTDILPRLYIALALVELRSKPADAKVKLDKAIALNTNDPLAHLLIGEMLNDEYEKLATEYKMMKPGPQQDEKLKQAQAKMDQIIEVYAQVVALSANKPEYKAIHDQILENLTSFYKYRHNNSTEGLQQLIDKHKKP